ncbi:b3 domain-containing protein [Quercus suber]|uniref:B3 domain-containing protein n=1 Tax=Quercus suber TaxID=58331 RepID=A0AAW0L7X1_QUESU
MTYYQTQRDHDNAPSDFAGEDSHFFKNILKETLCDQKLMIPNTFVRKYGENLSSLTFLKLPNGAKWKVELAYHNSEVWLQKGWKEFAECCSLKQGRLLVFR